MPTPNTPLSAWYAPLRSLLGDAEGMYGDHDYPDAVLDSAVRTVFAQGKAPTGCTLRNDSDAAVTVANLQDSTNVFPLLSLSPDASGAFAFGEIFLRAARLCVGGEEGGMGITTRPMSVRVSGDRNKRLIDWLECEISDLEAVGTFALGNKTWDQYLLSRP